MSMTTEPAETACRELARGFKGELIGPSDRSYDETRALYNAVFDKRPAAIARCASNADVARAIGFARSHELPLAIRGGANKHWRPRPGCGHA
jgi:FAD/FMN-containing dehydrogenase